MSLFPRPVVVVSRCLGFEACRYDGQILKSTLIDALARHVQIETVCPEVAIGLGTPRDPIRIEAEAAGEQRLVQPSTGRDLSLQMRSFAAGFLDDLGPEVDGFVLKNRSPSCAVRDAKVHASWGAAPRGRTGPGMFAQSVLQRYPGVAVEDEGRLSNVRVRSHFLTKIYTLADFRRARRRGTVGALVEFQTRHKHLLMAYNQTRLRSMGRLVAGAKGRPLGEVYASYCRELSLALARLPRSASIINVLQHGLGHVSNRLTAQERSHFLGLIERYRGGRLPLEALLSLLDSWIARFEVEYLQKQSFFRPYPEELVDMANSGKRREVT